METPPVRHADVIEGVRATIARYTHALDDGRVDDVVATFEPDGVFDMPGLGRFEGLDELRETYVGWAPQRPQRHLVMNTLLTEWDASEATALSDVVLVTKGDGTNGPKGWSVGFVARYEDVLRHHDANDTWRFVRRTVTT